MSKALVHKSLELFCDGELRHKRLNAKNGPRVSSKGPVSAEIHPERDLRKEQKKKRKHKNVGYKGVLDLIPSKHRIFLNNTDACTILGRSNRTTVYETQKRIAAQQDSTNDNVKKLLLLSHNSLKPETASNLLQRATKRRSTRKEEKLEESEKTVFSEEDFKNFEQEYSKLVA